MAIIKIRHQGALKKSPEHRSSRAFNGFVQEKRLSMVNDANSDSDDSDFAEVGCELAMVGDQMCDIPYDLFDLSELKDVLSIETWNSCLTEEERFNLAACLPDIDHDSFVITIKELLGGDNLFFGSPMEKFLNRLKSGFHSPLVARFREGLKFLEKRRHYHSLRLYHENMNQKYFDMRRAWSNMSSSTKIEERVRVLNRRKDQKPVLLVDLNALPEDEETLIDGDKKVEDFPLFKKTKYMDEGIKPSNFVIDLNHGSSSTKKKGKGVLKVRNKEMNSMSNYRIQPHNQIPKGVLKIKHKAERPITIPIQLAHTNTSLEQTDTLNGRPRDRCLNLNLGSSSSSQGFPRRIKTALSNKIQTRERKDCKYKIETRERQDCKNKIQGIE